MRPLPSAPVRPRTQCCFLSDVAQELDAAASAGMLTCQLLRPQDGTIASMSHAHAESFAEVQV